MKVKNFCSPKHTATRMKGKIKMKKRILKTLYFNVEYEKQLTSSIRKQRKDFKRYCTKETVNKILNIISHYRKSDLSHNKMPLYTYLKGQN